MPAPVIRIGNRGPGQGSEKIEDLFRFIGGVIFHLTCTKLLPRGSYEAARPRHERARAVSHAHAAALLVPLSLRRGSRRLQLRALPGRGWPLFGDLPPFLVFHTTAAAHLDFNGCVLSDSPARKRRLTLESFATVVQLEVVRWHPRAVAEGLMQEGCGQVQ
eukprot:scaffold11460_cov64-Phaeocystis_antarctica.AAC.13